MFDVTIYIETTIHGPAVRSGKGMWLIEYIRNSGEPETRQGITYRAGITENALILETMLHALKRLEKPCQIRINTRCEHVLNVMRNHWLQQWEKNDWKKKTGADIKNKVLWQQCKEEMDKHLVEMWNGNNPYEEVMFMEMQKNTMQNAGNH